MRASAAVPGTGARCTAAKAASAIVPTRKDTVAASSGLPSPARSWLFTPAWTGSPAPMSTASRSGRSVMGGASRVARRLGGDERDGVPVLDALARELELLAPVRLVALGQLRHRVIR